MGAASLEIHVVKRNRTKANRQISGAVFRLGIASAILVAELTSPMLARAQDSVGVEPEALQENSAPVIRVDVAFANGSTRRTEQIDARMAVDNGVEALDAQTLLSILEPRLTDEAYAALDARRDGDWISVSGIDEVGIEFAFDEAELSGELSVPAEMQPIQAVSVQGSRSRPDYPVADPATFSAAVPLNLSATYRQDDLRDTDTAGNSSYSLAARVNPRFSLGRALLSYNAIVDYRQERMESGGPPELTALDARMERDFGRLFRVGVGSVGATVAGPQPAQNVLGVIFERRAGIGGLSFERDSYRQVITVESDSTIEVRVNDRLVRSSRILPGQYELSDFPLVAGTNDVEITITDAFGRTRRIEERLHYARELLPRGDIEFSLSGGLGGADWVDVYEARGALGAVDSAATAVDVVPEILDAEYFAQVGMRFGILEPLTAELFGEAKSDSALAGAGLQLAGAAGALGVSSSASASRESGSNVDDTGYSVEGRYSLSFDRARWAPSFRVSGEYTSANFQAPGRAIASTSSREPDSWRTSASVTQPLPFGTSLLVGTRYTESREPQGRRTGVFASVSTRIGSTMSLRGTGRVTYDGEDTDWSARVGMSLRPAPRTTISSSYEAEQNAMSARLRQDAGNRNVDVSLSGGLSGISAGDGSISGLDASSRIRTTRAQASGGVRFDYTDGPLESGPDQVTARATFGSGIYFADGLFGVGRPTDGSYALVSRERTLPRGPVLVNPSDDGFEARSGILGAAVVTSLGDYAARPLRTDLPAVPIDYGLGETGRIIESGYRSGTAVRIDGERLLYGTGRLVNGDDAQTSDGADIDESQDGGPESGVADDALSLRVFDVYDDEGSRVTSAFTDEDGQFVVYDLRPGEYTISIDGNGRRARFSLDTEESLPVDLGTIRMVSE